jgi:hypothetical protein
MERVEATERLVGALKRLAKWCNQNELFRRRDAALRSILAFEPANAEARQLLRYRRERDGSWTQPRPYKEPRDIGSAKLPELAKLGAEMLERVEGPVLGMLDREPSLDSDRSRRPYLDALLVLDPENDRLHARLGEVRGPDGGAWILAESASALTRRSELALLAPRILEALPAPRPIEPEEFEKPLAGSWHSVLASEHLRILATDAADSAAECIRLAEATLALFDRGLKRESCEGLRFTIYLLAPEEKATFLARHPAVGPERASELSRFESFWVFDRSELVVCAKQPEFRIDHVVRQTISRELLDHFHLYPDSGVLHAGVTSYLASLVQSARAPSRADGARRADRPRALAAPRELLAVEGMLEKPASKLGRTEIETCRDLAGYLLEGWPERTADLLARTGSGTGLDPAMRATLGFELSTVEERYARWFQETRGEVDGPAIVTR